VLSCSRSINQLTVDRYSTRVTDRPIIVLYLLHYDENSRISAKAGQVGTWASDRHDSISALTLIDVNVVKRIDEVESSYI